MNALRSSVSLFLALAACAQEPETHGDRSPEKPSLHAAFDRLLRERVRDGLVDYDAIRKHDQDTLTGYLDTLAKVDVDELGKQQQFALYVNLYNATMIQAVLDHTEKHPDWTPAANDFGVFKEKRVRLKTGTVTLDDLENKILRPRFEDPRVHVAIVCGARSCPPLLPRAYEAKDLDEVLDEKMQAFLHDTSRNRVDAAGKKVHLSKIFEWFADDFGGEKGIRKLLQQQLGKEVAGYAIDYLDYSWALNKLEKAGK